MKTLTIPAKHKRDDGSSEHEKLDRVVGRSANLPDDMAANHDFYLHGTHKQYPRKGRWIPADKARRQPTRAQIAAFERMTNEFAAELEGLPADLAKNLRHYLHGHPKAKK